jgi:hypothetical protein
MRERFKALEMIQGMKQVLAISRASGNLEHGSDGVDTDSVSVLSEVLLEIINTLPSEVSHLTAELGNSRLLVYVIREYMLVLNVDPGFNINELRYWIKNISSRLQEKSEKKKDSKLAKLESVTANTAQLVALAHAVEAISGQAAKELGSFVTINALKEVRENLLPRSKALFSFLVQKDGRIVVREAMNVSVAETSRLVARWMMLFLKRCHEIVPTFPSELVVSLLEPKRAELEGLGFYEAWQEAKERHKGNK